MAGINAMGFSGVGFEVNGALKLLFRLDPVPVEMIDIAKRAVSLGQRAVELKGFLGGILRLAPCLQRRQLADGYRSERVVAGGQSRIGRRIGRVFLDCALEILDGFGRLFSLT